MKWLTAICTALVLAPVSTLAADDAHEAVGFNAQVLMKTTRAADDTPVELPHTDKPEITAIEVTIKPGGHSNLHQHPVPTIAYVLDGALETHIGGVVRSYKTGEALIEPQNIDMQAFNPGSAPTRVLVIFVGEEGKPNAVAAKAE